MNPYEIHEVFEIEVLAHLNSHKILPKLIFGGGTMLRLCHGLPRYSVDLDFWKSRSFNDEDLLNELNRVFSYKYEITDSALKRFTILLEIRSSHYPRRLKIEIRRELKNYEYEAKIAYSPFSHIQVPLYGHTLKQTLNNKIEAFLERGAIRDAFDIEYLLRQGVQLPELSKETIQQLIQQLEKFSVRDFKVTLGSIIAPNLREYYQTHGFNFLKTKLLSLLTP